MDEFLPGMRAISAEGVDVGALGGEVIVGTVPYLTVWPSAGAPRPVLIPRDAVLGVDGATVRLAWPAARIFDAPGPTDSPGVFEGAPTRELAQQPPAGRPGPEDRDDRIC